MKLEVGQIWRKHGPADWLRIEQIQMDGHPDYDGGAPGVSVSVRTWKGRWKNQRWFYLANTYKQFIQQMKDSFRYLEEP